MYKVFFKDRTVFFSDDFNTVIAENEGLFFKYGSKRVLKAVMKGFYYLDEIDKLYLIGKDMDKMWKDFQSAFTLVRAGGGLIRNEKGEVLFIKRNGLWDLPKGKLDADEKILETAIREVKEECGLQNIEAGEKLAVTYHTYPLKEKFILKETSWFNMFASSDQKLVPQEIENITSAMWVKPSEISYLSGNTYASIKDVLKKAALL